MVQSGLTKSSENGTITNTPEGGDCIQRDKGGAGESGENENCAPQGFWLPSRDFRLTKENAVETPRRREQFGRCFKSVPITNAHRRNWDLVFQQFDVRDVRAPDDDELVVSASVVNSLVCYNRFGFACRRG